MSLFSGWEVVSGERNLELYIRNINGDKVHSVSLDPWNVAETGYSFIVPSSIGTFSALYEGHAYYQVIKKDASAANKIALQYIHDGSNSFDISYGVSIEPGFIGVNGISSKLYSWTDVLDFTATGE